MHRVATNARRLLPGALLTSLLAAVTALPAQAAWELNMTQGVTSTAQEAYDLHMLVLWICTIVGIGVFAVMIYAIVTFQKAKGAVPATFTHSTKAEVIWTVIPTLILVFLGYETAPALVRIDDTRNSEMTIKITGYQWKWQYEYVGEDYSFFSTLADTSNAARQLGSGVNPHERRQLPARGGQRRWSCPAGVKIRYLLTANDVLHAWWVPAFSREARRHPRLRERGLVQGRQARRLSRPVRGTLRQGPRLHADRRRGPAEGGVRGLARREEGPGHRRRQLIASQSECRIRSTRR